jgi:tetratricopeptide (TPR) repeat protein
VLAVEKPPDIDYSADGVATSGNITLYLSSYPDDCLAEYPDLYYTSKRFIYDNGDYWTWGNYSLKGDINGTLYSYRLYFTSDSTTTFKIEIEINKNTVATFPLLTVPSDPYYLPFSGTVTGLDPITSSGDEVILKITKISGSRGSILHGGTASYVTIPPLAMEDYNKAIELDPNYADAYYNRGLAHYDLKEYERAIEDYNKAIELDPNYVNAYYNRGLAYYYLMQYERAIEDYNKTIELDPNYAHAYNNRGIAYYYLMQYERAIEDYNKTIALDPNDADAYNNRGLARNKLKEQEGEP